MRSLEGIGYLFDADVGVPATRSHSSVGAFCSGAGLSDRTVSEWLACCPHFDARSRLNPREFSAWKEAAVRFWREGAALLSRLPPKPERNPREEGAAEAIKRLLRGSRAHFMRANGALVYSNLTNNLRDYYRVEDLVYVAAERFPGLVPTHDEVTREHELKLKDQEGLEVDHGLFLSEIFARPGPGTHLVHAMLRPRLDSLSRLAHFRRTGFADLGTVLVERRGNVGHLTLHNTRFLNALDDSTAAPMETGVDLILLDDQIKIGILRGDRVDKPRYEGRRVFCSGLNLTRLYHGKIPFLFYMLHELGYVNKMFRGLGYDGFRLHGPETTLEKAWIAAVESFAIGGGCQLTLVVDYVLAEEGSYFSLPARNEGIIPGAGNLRLSRFLGERLARQGILFGRRFEAQSPEGRLLCDEVVERGRMDAAIETTVGALVNSGIVSLAGNRNALRANQEPLEKFRAYMAIFAREQAFCHFSPELVRNLAENWGADKREP